MATLFEINQQLATFEFDVDPETGELLNAPDWDGLNMAYEEKVENIACYIKNLTSDAAALRAEEKALAARRQTAEKKAEYLKKLLDTNMNGQNFSTAKCAITFRKSPPSVSIEDEAAFVGWAMDTGNDVYLTYKAPTPNKTAIKDAIKVGKEVTGCALVQNSNLVIK